MTSSELCLLTRSENPFSFLKHAFSTPKSYYLTNSLWQSLGISKPFLVKPLTEQCSHSWWGRCLPFVTLSLSSIGYQHIYTLFLLDSFLSHFGSVDSELLAYFLGLLDRCILIFGPGRGSFEDAALATELGTFHFLKSPPFLSARSITSLSC